MAIEAGTYRFGPENGTLSVRTGRTGAAAKAGHDLLLHVTAWKATLEVGEYPRQTTVTLDADATSLRVREGTGGMQALGDDDKASIEQTIDEEVLQRQGIAFRSTSVDAAPDGSRLTVHGELTLVGRTCPITVGVTVGDGGTLAARGVVKQTDWGIKPYSTLFGALKVADEVEVAVDATYRRVDQGRVAARLESSDGNVVGPRPVHPRRPLIAPGVSTFLWALFFFLYLWLGMAAVGPSLGTALPLALVASFFIYLFVRKNGAGRPQD